jgi:hypothetical protein
MKPFIRFFCLLATSFYAAETSAQIFDIKVTNYGTSDASVRRLVDEQIALIEADINEGLPSTDPDRLMEGMANSSVMAGKGIGTDYASGMTVFLLGAGVGVGADLKKDENTDGDLSGANAASGLVIGYNLGFMDTERIFGMETNRLNMYMNFMSYGHDTTLNDNADEKSEASLDMTSGGVHFRYDWVKGAGTKFLGWGGIKFHFGYEYNKTDITFKSTIKKELDDDSFTGTINGAPEAKIATTTHSFPFALSTDAQIFYLLSLYTGIGADFNMGQSKAKGSLNGGTSPITCSSGTECDGAGNPTITVQPRANIDGTGNVTPFLFRGFAGLQINLPYFRIFGQVDKAFGNDLIGATAGVRFVY